MPAATAPLAPEGSAKAAREAGLRYVSDARPGLSRRRAGKAFSYRDADGRPVRDRETLARIRALAIPPAWADVWICPSANGHIQAAGRDARGRKQYRYHAKWRAVRDADKYGRLLRFAAALPRLRRRVTADLRRPGMGRERVLATVTRLLETTLIRVGNEEYARTNGSFGLATMRNRHARVRGAEVVFEFKGKSGVRHHVGLRDPRVAKVVRACQELPGQDLFEYVGEDGEVHNLTSDDVNAYLRDIAGEEFSAKDFRTWAGTVLAAAALRRFEKFATAAEAKRNLVAAVESVARELGNTPAVCRKCYVHPAVLDAYLSGETVAVLRDAAEARLGATLGRLSPTETAVLMFLRDRLGGSRGRRGRQLARSN